LLLRKRGYPNRAKPAGRWTRRRRHQATTCPAPVGSDRTCPRPDLRSSPAGPGRSSLRSAHQPVIQLELARQVRRRQALSDWPRATSSHQRDCHAASCVASWRPPTK